MLDPVAITTAVPAVTSDPVASIVGMVCALLGVLGAPWWAPWAFRIAAGYFLGARAAGVKVEPPTEVDEGGKAIDLHAREGGGPPGGGPTGGCG